MGGHLFLYGPPGSGKTTLGRRLARRLGLFFLDVDKMIEDEAKKTIRRIFEEEGERAFRAREKQTIERLAARPDACVVSLGGGALLNTDVRACVEAHGRVVCLDCAADVLRRRIAAMPGVRPLVANGGAALDELLARRESHYRGFRYRLDTTGQPVEDLCAALEVLFGRFRIESGDVPSDIVVGERTLDMIGPWTRAQEMGRRAVVVCDANTDALYGEKVAKSLQKVGCAVARAVIPAGEATKSIDAVQRIWRAFLEGGLGRGDFAVAVGGGVTGDLTGFAAATWMRGIRWINVPTTLLAMVDASTGGKTGCDLPEGKNLVGAFHSPSLVAADVTTLRTLPAREWRCGLAEAVKHALIDDPSLTAKLELFSHLKGRRDEEVYQGPRSTWSLAQFVSRALAVKVRIVRQDPRERDVRAKLNLGHTVGHAVETATGFKVRHGEAVAIGTVEEARLAVRQGLAVAAWPDQVARLFAAAGLRTRLPDGLTFDALAPVMARDKKQRDGRVFFALPCGMGDVRLVPIAL